MSFSPQELHIAAETMISVSSISCSLFVMYLALYCTKNQTAKVYTHMLIMNACVDFSYSFVNLVTMPIYYINGGFFIVSIGNPFLPNSIFLAKTSVVVQAALDYISVIMLPIQFIYRYRVLCNKPPTSLQLFKMFVVGAVWPILHGLYCYVTFRPPNPVFEAVLVQNPIIAGNESLPPYVATEANSLPVALHFLNCVFITIPSYTIIVIVHRMTAARFAEFEANITESTKRVQRQMERVIVVQACFPIFVLFVPGTILPAAVVFKWRYHYVGEFISLLMHTTPLFNSISVLLCVPSYRRIVLGCLSGRRFGMVASSSGKFDDHSTTQKTSSKPFA